MSGSVNKVILVGNLGRDPEVRRTGAGDPVVNFSLALSESWRDKNTGERKEKTEWVNVVIFNEALGKVAEQYLKKGAKVYIEGQLQTRKFTDKDGNERQTTEVVLQRYRGELTMLSGRNESGGGDYAPEMAGSSGGSNFGRSSPMEGRSTPRSAPAGDRRPATAGGGRMSESIDDDIPF